MVTVECCEVSIVCTFLKYMRDKQTVYEDGIYWLTVNTVCQWICLKVFFGIYNEVQWWKYVLTCKPWISRFSFYHNSKVFFCIGNIFSTKSPSPPQNYYTFLQAQFLPRIITHFLLQAQVLPRIITLFLQAQVLPRIITLFLQAQVLPRIITLFLLQAQVLPRIITLFLLQAQVLPRIITLYLQAQVLPRIITLFVMEWILAKWTVSTLSVLLI
jgi:hypothetical protein